MKAKKIILGTKIFVKVNVLYTVYKLEHVLILKSLFIHVDIFWITFPGKYRAF